jgi:PEP-CTERM motif
MAFLTLGSEVTKMKNLNTINVTVLKILAGLGCMFMVGSAQATWTGSFNDTVNGISGTLTDTGSFGGYEVYTLDFTVGTSGAALGQRMTAVDIKAFSGYTSFTFTASTGLWTNPPGTGPISSGGAAGTDGCTGVHINSAPTFQPALVIASGQNYQFTFNVLGATGLNTTGSGAHVGVGFTQYDLTGNAGIVSENTSPSPIPEPETYAMLLAGLGLVGFSARRRMKNDA